MGSACAMLRDRRCSFDWMKKFINDVGYYLCAELQDLGIPTLWLNQKHYKPQSMVIPGNVVSAIDRSTDLFLMMKSWQQK
ncbi:hypothetical protein ACE1B6_00290 [Aerosakkonemataceae cyanobacterium BLCC-F154]|uniref:Uncharacterized protein n=1 Tax=Floridaenema fluviatile BLCC-F154 TaxID=3153640 RepID=A0ABV4Y4F2_9CYAN